MGEASNTESPGVAVVTGGGTGIGRGCVELFARRGLDVVVVGRTQATLDETVTAIEASGGRARAVAADCATPAGREAIVAAVAGLGQPVAALVHAAGADLVMAFTDTTPEQLDFLLDVNVRAPFFLTQQLVPHLAEGAGVVFVGSISATRARPRHAAYATSKAALVGLTANLAVDLAPSVRVNCVSPGATRTGMLRAFVKESARGLDDDERARQLVADMARMPLGRVAEPHEVATVCVHLAIDATAVTGVDMPVDVGYAAT
jgi:NAD(P)-dependent dehydrogenase (short-subunit alcohol dehydrogenase family)